MQRFVAAIAVLLLSAPAFAAEPARRPNVVFILADDLGWADITPYGSTNLAARTRPGWNASS